MQSLLSIKSILSGSESCTQLFSSQPVVGGECSGSDSLLRCDPGFFSKMSPKSVQVIMSWEGGAGSHLQTTPAQGGTEIEKRLLLLAFERLSQLTLTLLCYQLVRPNKIKQSFKCVSSVDIIFKIILRYLFFYYRILILIVVYILTIFSCDLLTPLGMSFFLAFTYLL